MHDYVYWHCSTDYTVLNKFSDTRIFAKNGYNFIMKWFLLNYFGGKLQIDAKNSSRKFCEHPLYEISEYAFNKHVVI